MTGYWFNQNATSTLTITGLVSGRYYNVSCFGSRAASGRNTVYTVGGQSINLNCSNNTTQTANFYGVSADSSGSLRVQWTCQSGQTYGYINALTVAEA